MNLVNVIRFGCIGICIAFADPSSSSNAKSINNQTLRPPFSLKLNLENGKVLQEQLDSVPYVNNDIVYLFNNDVMGVRLTLNRDSSFSLAYEPDTGKSDVSFSFKQDPNYGAEFGMILMITNKTSFTVNFSAGMNLPGKTNLVWTSILPIKPKLKNYETWPHPIRELILLEWNGKNQKQKMQSK